MANEVQSIKIEYSDDAMWGSEGFEGHDVKASYAKFEQMVTAKLNEVYPGAEVEFTNGINDKTETWNPEDGWERNEDVSWAIHPIWESFDWAVENNATV